MIRKEHMDRVGGAITGLRNEREMSLPTLASILLLEPKEMEEIENGIRMPEDHTVRLLANVFGVNKGMLERGQIIPVRYREKPEVMLDGLEKSIEDLNDKIAFLLEEVQTLRAYDEYRVELLMDEGAYYVIMDLDTGDYLRGDSGVMYEFHDMEQALTTAEQLESGTLKPEDLRYFDEFSDPVYQAKDSLLETEEIMEHDRELETKDEVSLCPNTETIHI